MSEPLLEVDNLVRHYDRPKRGLFSKKPIIEALRGVSFKVDSGESFGIVGESGSGKSTLARAILALEEPTSGTVRLMGRDIFNLAPHQQRSMRRHVQMVFQDPFGSLDPRQSVRDIVTEPLNLVDDINASEWEQRGAEAIASVGLQASDLDKYPHEFSGGQRQRIAIARALITKPNLIVADEPVSALDVSVQAQVLNLMMDLQEDYGLTYVIISHDLAVMRHITDRLAVMEAGRIVEQGQTADIFENPQHAYTQELLDSVLDIPDPREHDKAHAQATRPSSEAEKPIALNRRPPEKKLAATIPAATATPQGIETRSGGIHESESTMATGRHPEQSGVWAPISPSIEDVARRADNQDSNVAAVPQHQANVTKSAPPPPVDRNSRGDDDQESSEERDNALALQRQIAALKSALPSDEEEEDGTDQQTNPKSGEEGDNTPTQQPKIAALKSTPSSDEEQDNADQGNNELRDNALALQRQIAALKSAFSFADEEGLSEENELIDQDATEETKAEGLNLIDGRWQEAVERETIQIVNPSDGTVFGSLARGQAADIDLAVKAAENAMAGPWGRMPAFERGRVLTALARLVLNQIEHLAALEAKDVGKPLRQARADAVALARYFEFYGGAADKVHGQTIPYHDGYTVLTLREPHGITGHIVPWNYPMQIIGRSVGAALAMGNACVLKPGEDASLTALEIGKLALEAGLPPGVLNIITGLGGEAGAALAAHPGIDHLSFTGSVETGKLVQKAAADHSCPVTLELGGKSPQLVFADADLEKALPFLVNAAIQNAGQTCSAGSRVLIQDRIYDDVVHHLAQRFDNLGVGPADRDLDCGPVINPLQKQRIQGYLNRAKTDGIDILGEGNLAPDTPENGYYVRPTLLGDVAPNHLLAQEEIFGPVLTAIRFTNEEDAIRIANDSAYGLVAGVWTNHGGRQMRLARAIKTGQVFINNYGAGGGVELPFGGVKSSGFGREKGFDALYGFSTLKTIAIHH